MTRVMNLHTILQVILELSVKSPSVSRPIGALAPLSPLSVVSAK
jgi:hypothetical protein